MGFPFQNGFTNFLSMSEVLEDNDLYETRVENDANGNPLYVGKSVVPQAETDLPIWYIRKVSYDANGFLARVQLPYEGLGFKYVWDLRGTYF